MISIVIPTHNRSEMLKRALTSVLNQTYTDTEIIVVSDGSTDNTEEVVKKYQEEYKNIQLIVINPGKGANNARNKGIEVAKGEYIAFLDDDDEWHPTKLETQTKVFKSNPSVGLVYTGINVIYVKEKLEYYSLSGFKGDLSKDILIRNVIGATPSVMVKKEVLNKSGYFDMEMPAKQDYDLWIRICQITEVGFVDQPQVSYYNYSGEEQISKNTKKHERALEIINKKYTNLFNQLSEKERNQQKINYNIGIANIALRNNNKKLGFKYSYRAFKQKPNLKSFTYMLATPLPFKFLLKIKNKT